MEVLTEVSTSGLAWNVLQGSIHPQISPPQLKLRDIYFHSSLSNPRFTSVAVLSILTI
jgi:hypothetical protein